MRSESEKARRRAARMLARASKRDRARGVKRSKSALKWAKKAERREMDEIKENR